ncbi:EAL domain-containing protein [Massilia eurypsychrophila]|nr:EAL domain-containing protein [Massilia eurypsychrophila]
MPTTKQVLIERQLSEVQNVAHVGIWEYLCASGKLIWSDETYRIAGIDRQYVDASIDAYIAAVHPDDRGKVLAMLEQARRGSIQPMLEHRVVWPNGEVRELIMRGYPFVDQDGQPAMAGTLADLTGVKRSKAALRALSRKLVTTLESMTDAFYMLDNDWRFTYLNSEAERLLQQRRDELLGKVLWKAFPDLIGTRFETQYRQAMAQHRPAAFEELYVPFHAWKELRIFPSREGLAVYFTDISERKSLQEIERQNAERFRLVANTTTDIIWDWDLAQDRVWWNEGMRNAFGYTPDQIDEGIAIWARRIHPDERAGVLSGLLKARDEGGHDWHADYRFMRRDGAYVDVRDRCIFIRAADGSAQRAIGAMLDVTAQKRAEAERADAEARNRVQASLLDKALDAISATDINGRITYWNKGAQRLYGWTSDEVIGAIKADLIVADRAPFERAFGKMLQQGEWTGELLKRRKDGSTVCVEAHLTLMRDDDGGPHSMLCIDTDITQRKRAEREIEDLAFFDLLTALPNRRLLLDRMRHAVATCRRTGRTGAVLFLDLDNFKSLNDTLGHDKGDLLLQQVALRLRSRVPRASDTVARHGGDEFVIVLEDLSDQPAEAAAQAERIAEKILAVFDTPFHLDGHQHPTTSSIGVALFTRHSADVDELLKRADLAMYQAKSAGRSTIRFYDPQMQIVISARVQLEADLRHGLKQHEFDLVYQSQTDGAGHTTGAEALIRWRHPRRRLVMPAMFIPLAEETGLILPLGQWVLETACRQLVAWARSAVTAHLTMAVNVSAHQFRQPDFVQMVQSVVSRTGADPAKLKLELTESLLVADVERTIDKMNALRAMGISLALDDFGTGYSSLSYLKRLPLDQLKIDKSFVRDVLTDPSDAAIARTILLLGHTLGLDVIAEGVETESQRDFLAQNGCLAYQGFLFSQPVPAEQF